MAIDNFNVTPYFDDYADSKKFYRILFKPGFAVQARELTQMQTILQNQISRFGNHIFKDGTYVKGGEGALNIDAQHLKVDSSSITLENAKLLIGQKIVGSDSGAIADVVAVEAATLTDPLVLITTPKNGINFFGGEVVTVTETESLEISAITLTTLNTTNVTGPASTFNIAEGIVFAKGFFCFVEQQIIVLDKFGATPSFVVGLKFSDVIVTTDDDETLLDPANGSFNFNAPGADRYKIDFNLIKKPLGTDPAAVIDFAEENFVQIASIKEGKIFEEIKYPIYSELEETFARRTYDESGDYTVTPFKIQVTEHVGGDPAKLSIGLSPGKAYVRGFEFATSSTQNFDIDRARDTQFVRRFDTITPFESYIIISNVVDGFNVNQFEKISLRNSSNSEIGFAFTKYLEYVAAGVYKLYIFNITMTVGVFEDTNSIFGFSGSGTAFIHPSGKQNGLTRLFGNDKRIAFATLPQSFIANIDPVGDLFDISYRSQQVFFQTFNNGQVTISAPAGTQFPPFGTSDIIAKINFVVFDLTNNIPREIQATNITINPNGTAATINFNNPLLSFQSIIYAIIEADPIPIVKKQLKTSTQVINIAGLTTAQRRQFSLNVPDGFKIVDIFMSATPNEAAQETDPKVTNDYMFDNGQRDDCYDHARIVLNGNANPATGNLLVKFQHFTYVNNASGVFTVDSYAQSGVEYKDIPTYTASNGSSYKLRDVIDFRPVRDPNASTFRGVSVSPFYEVEASYNYYIPRIDKVIATKDKEFRVIKGVSSISPTAPADIDNSMNLYILTIPPFTENPGDVQIKFIENKRYTMRDIGRLETRIKNLEYYTSLAFLEKQAKDQTIRDGTGSFDRFKNGFIVDSFAGHGVGDVGNFDYRCSMDFVAQFLRPSFDKRNFKFFIDNAADLTNVTRKGQLLQLTPTGTEAIISQGLSSKAISVNPFNVTNWYGTLHLSPNNDVWYDTVTRPDVLINLSGENDAWQFVAEQTAHSTKWNDWQDNWSTRSTLGERVIGETDVGAGARNPVDGRPSRVIRQDLERTVRSSTSQTRTGIETSVSFETVQQSFGERVVDLSVIPFMRAAGIRFVAKGLKPSARVYAFFDDVNVNEYIVKAPQLRFDQSTLSDTVNRFITEETNEEFVVGLSSNARALAVSQNIGQLNIVSLQGSFQVGEIVRGERSNISFTLSDFSLPVLGSSEGGPAQFITDAQGEFTGVFLLPNNSTIKFRAGEKQLRFTDSPTNVVKNATTTAEASYFAQGYTKTVENTVVSTVQAKLARRSVNEDRIVTNVFTERGAGLNRDVTRYYDPLAQTFLIDPTVYPNGVYIDSVDAFFRQKDNGVPVTCQIRPAVNGYPSSATILPFAEKTLNPIDVKTTLPVPVGFPEELVPSLTDDRTNTNFKFDSPVFLVPGEYAIVLLSNSNKYEAYVAEIGGTQIGSNKLISDQPYTGSLFKSQNSSTWTPVQEEDLMFRLNALKFPTEGQAFLTLDNSEYYVDPTVGAPDDFRWHTGQIMSSSITTKESNVTYSYSALRAVDNQFGQYIPVEPLENFGVPTEQKFINESGDFKLKIQFSSNDAYVTPSVDMTRLALTAVKNIINSTNENETAPQGGSAAARYITRRVTLNDGFDATDLKVFLDIDFGRGDVEVYYKIINEADAKLFEEREWVRMGRKLNGNLSSPDIFKEYEFFVQAENKNNFDEIVYKADAANPNSTLFVGFRTFAIKVVMLSSAISDGSDKLAIPRIRNLRAIALA